MSAPERLALNQREAAKALGVSVPTFRRHIQPELRVVYVGGRHLYAVSELERWLSKSAS